MVARLPEMVAEYPDGRRFRMPAHDSDYAAVFFYGEFEAAESAVMRRLLRPGDFAIDVGANLGWYSILMSVSVSMIGTVWAFEPVPATRELLQENLALNADHVVHVHSCALAAAPGVILVHTFRGLPHGHASVSNLGRSDFVAQEVSAETLDRLVARAQTPPPLLVKLDAEGAELAILRGAAEICASNAAPIWLIEANRETAAAFGYQPAALVQQLRDANDYRIYRIVAKGLAVERDAERVHGVTWACVPPSLLDRAKPCLVAA